MKRRQARVNFITAVLVLLMLIIFFGTVYFALDVFGIISVPSKYSIASLFYSQIEIIATGGEVLTEDIVVPDTDDTIFIEKNNQNINSEIEEEQDEITNVQNPLAELEQLQNQQQINNSNINNEEKKDVNVKRFYYQQLDKYGKIIYDKLYSNMDKLKTGTYTADFGTTFNELLHQENGSDTLNNSFQLAINALTFDNPELFYIDITKINLITEITTRAFSTTYEVSVGGNGNSYLSEEFENVYAVTNEIANIEQIKKDVLNKTGENKIENLKIAHDYLVDSIEYDGAAGKNVYNIYGALINKKAVCEGYAKAYKLLLDELGIPCIVACGIGRNSTGENESHAWNYVYLDDAWYAVDVTWDDPVIIGNGTITDEIRYRYFLVGAEKFFEDHFEDGNIAAEFYFEYPKLSTSNY